MVDNSIHYWRPARKTVWSHCSFLLALRPPRLLSFAHCAAGAPLSVYHFDIIYTYWVLADGNIRSMWGRDCLPFVCFSIVSFERGSWKREPIKCSSFGKGDSQRFRNTNEI